MKLNRLQLEKDFLETCCLNKWLNKFVNKN